MPAGLQPFVRLGIIWRVTSNAATLTDAIERAGHRITGPRLAATRLIAARDGPFTAADLAADARARGLRIGRATIFRAIDLLVELEVIERIDLPTGEHAYVSCRAAHHHHLVCSGCGRATDVDDSGLRAVVAEIAARTGYRIDDHRLELFGRCAACQAGDRNGPGTGAGGGGA